MDYKILTSKDIFELEKKVREAIADLWEPLGSVGCTDNLEFFYQAMIRTEENRDERKYQRFGGVR